MMDDIKTFSLSRHSRLFSVPDSNKDYLFVRSGVHPYHEEPSRAESYAIVFIREGGVTLNTGLVSWQVNAPSIITLGPSQEATGIHQRLIIRSYIFVLIYEIDAYYRQHISNTSSSETEPLFTKFRHLLSQHYLQEHKLDFYARHLHLAPKSLSAAIKKHTGTPAGKWIDDTIVLEAKVLTEVLKVYYHTNEAVIWQELAMYKMATSIIEEQVNVERLLRRYGARVVVIRRDYTIFEVSGQREETDNLATVLQPYGLIEFVRSARIPIIKDSEGFNRKMREFEKTHE